MKKVLLFANVFLLSIYVLFSSCEKRAVDCPAIDYSRVSMERFGRIVIELRDSQGRDLLNPATPGHYDTAQLKTINTFPVFLMDVNENQFIGNKDRIRLLMYFENPYTPIKLKLSNTVTDNFVAKFVYPDSGCNVVENLASVTYNGVFYRPWMNNYAIL